MTQPEKEPMSLNFRRHYPVLIALVVIASILTFALGDLRVIAYTTRTESTATTKTLYNFTNDVDLLDDTVVHSIQVIMSDVDYDTMVTTYQQTGLKEYFNADIIIDGVRINNVGIRLKGNASLSTALGTGRGFGNLNRPDNGNMPQRPNNGQPPEGFDPADRPQPPQGFNPGEMPQMGENFQMPGAGQGQERGGMGQQASADQVKIPFMVKFDEYEDQTYQGLTAISIRTYGVSYDEALLHEPVTNTVARLAGIPATETSYTGFRINEDDETLYVVSELVNEEYLEKYFENIDGILYKAEVGSTLSYEGEDPSSYADSFTQQTRVNDADLAPLIAFMRFLDQSDDATFESNLLKYLDVDSFATYLAVNASLVNTDSMIGMNNNYYLYYDDESGQFTLLMWDANESLGKLGGSATYDISLTNTQSGFGGRGGMGGSQNALLERFMASDKFKTLYEEKLRLVYQEAFISGAMTGTVERYSALIHSANKERGLVALTAYDQAVEKVLYFINQRMEYLETTELLGQ
jgi:spore coat protein CotH